MRMSEVMNAYTFHSRFFCSSVHLVMQIALGYHEYTVMFINTVELSDEVLYLLRKKFRHFNHTIALGGFRIGDNILPLDTS